MSHLKWLRGADAKRDLLRDGATLGISDDMLGSLEEHTSIDLLIATSTWGRRKAPEEVSFSGWGAAIEARVVLALAAEVPVDGRLVVKPYTSPKKWRRPEVAALSQHGDVASRELRFNRFDLAAAWDFGGDVSPEWSMCGLVPGTMLRGEAQYCYELMLGNLDVVRFAVVAMDGPEDIVLALGYPGFPAIVDAILGADR